MFVLCENGEDVDLCSFTSKPDFAYAAIASCFSSCFSEPSRKIALPWVQCNVFVKAERKAS